MKPPPFHRDGFMKSLMSSYPVPQNGRRGGGAMRMKASEIGDWRRQVAGKHDHHELMPEDYVVVRPGPNFHWLMGQGNSARTTTLSPAPTVSSSLLASLRELEARRVSLVALNGMMFDISTPHGRMMATVLAGLA